MQIFLIVVSILSIHYLLLTFLASPSSKPHKDLQIVAGKFIAHRGLHDENIPENSISSFFAAVENDLLIEIDLHLTKDGEVVVFHDETLKRMCGSEKRINDLTLEEIKKFRLLKTNEQIPKLTECLRAVDGKVPLLIEFKMERNNTKSLCEAADKILSEYNGDYLIQSFYPQVVRWYKKHRKDVCRGQLSCRFKKKGFAKWLSGNLLLNFMGRPHFISYKHSDSSNPMLKFCIWLGAFPIGWTFRSKKELKESQKHFKTWIFENIAPEKI